MIARPGSIGIVLAALLLGGCAGTSHTADETGETTSRTGVDRQAEYEQVLAAQDRRHECMAELGYTVTEEDGEVGIEPMPGDEGYETVPARSLETFVAEMQRAPESVMTPPWDPLSHELVGAAVIELQELCPAPSIYTIIYTITE
ncbi:hypothetical protein MWU75_01715 [Ornithinimicrobium sp. F0845]|uniref:hypothetical protein n=1 Tax=Ornithinimicrobium sp. F0845 TaxID=2926412 RepID=UPI001FF59AFB|nr:hypothetical protein [Ornithinimicrobium sp. F0845]MCK0110860.1 hypothetical protein [Ornithinimicrobium sp. F0845]